jgi:1-acyl-sn-glycerol-3-phosphate acyltransferase
MSEAFTPRPVSPVVWWIGFLIIAPFVLGVCRLRRRGQEHLPRTGPLLIVSNHISLKDPPFVGSAARPRKIHYMAKSELFRNPVFGRLITAYGAFPVIRGGADRQALRAARDLLAAGEAVVMFPEGTRSPDGRPRAPFPGAGALALDPAVTVVPAAIWGTRAALGPVRVVFGPPLDLSDLASGPRSARASEAARRMMAAISALLPSAGGPGPE